MPIYIGDYLAATSRLTTEQHGAYLLLIMDYWRNGPLPDNDQVLSQITRMSADAWSNARSILQAYFTHSDNRWFHTRIDEELERASVRRSAAVSRGKAGAAGRWGVVTTSNDASSNASSNASSIDEAMLEGLVGDSSSQSQLKEKKDITNVISKEKPDYETERSIIDYLNAKAGKSFRHVQANVRLITARLSEGHTREDIEAVIDRKCAEWPEGDRMHEYLRPATLFGAEKFNQYVGEIGKKPAQRGRSYEENQSVTKLSVSERATAARKSAERIWAASEAHEQSLGTNDAHLRTSLDIKLRRDGDDA